MCLRKQDHKNNEKRSNQARKTNKQTETAARNWEANELKESKVGGFRRTVTRIWRTWAYPGFTPSKQTIVTENSTTPAFSVYLGCPHGQEVMAVHYYRVLEVPNHFLKLQLLCVSSWQSQQLVINSGTCQVRGTVDLGNWQEQSKEWSRGAFLQLLSQFCSEYHTIFRKFEILWTGVQCDVLINFIISRVFFWNKLVDYLSYLYFVHGESLCLCSSKAPWIQVHPCFPNSCVPPFAISREYNFAWRMISYASPETFVDNSHIRNSCRFDWSESIHFKAPSSWLKILTFTE